MSAPLWDQRRHGQDLRAAAKRHGLTVDIRVNFAFYLEQDGRPIVKATFGARGQILRARALAESGAPVLFPPYDMPSSVTTPAEVRDNLVAWLDAGRPDGWEWRSRLATQLEQATAPPPFRAPVAHLHTKGL